MHSATRRPAMTLLVLALIVAACGSPTPSRPAATRAPSATAAAEATRTPPATVQPEPTEVPGGGSGQVPGPVTTRLPTTQTDWGQIVDIVPQGFPVYPGAAIAEPPPEPVSGAWISSAGVDTVATWYRHALEATGKSTLGLSSPLEDGSRVLDMQGDLPECRLQLTFRPEGGSTMIIVLVAAGCVGGEG